MQRFANILVFSILASISCQSVRHPSTQSQVQNTQRPLPSLQGPGTAIVQLFNWKFSDVKKELCYLQSIGVSHVHVSPAQKSNPAEDWWARYQPDDLRVIDSPLGNMNDFKSMIAEAQRCGVGIIADIVINHMANYNWNADELYYPRGCDRNRPYDFTDLNSCLYRPEHFHTEECIRDYSNHGAVMYGRICGGAPDRGIPDLRTGNTNETEGDPHVLGVVQSYLRMLYDLGVRGFRLDAAKHMHPHFVERAISALPVDAWIYGEIITDHRDGFGQYYNIDNLDLMDFPLTRSMIEAFNYGGQLTILVDAERRGRALSYDKSIAFVTNHDVWGNESGLGYRYEGSDAATDELLAHLFILGRGLGAPYIYSETDDGPSLRYRSRNQSFVRYHRRFEIERMLLFHNLAGHQGPTWRYQDQNHLAWSRGTRAFMAINKSGETWNISREIELGLEDGSYLNLLDGNPNSNLIEVQGGKAEFTVPARFGLALVPASTL